MRSFRYFQRMMSGRATDWKVDVAMASTCDVVVAELLEALGPGPAKAPWKAREPGKQKGGDGSLIRA